ncbi:S-methyl-5-thioribose-1-phosphate isomerase, partial [Pseudomonas aeruginosa]
MRDRLLAAEKVKAIQWRDGALHLLDQRVLPSHESWVACVTVEAVADAIRTMVVRGAPAIGICAAYGLVLAARERIAEGGDWQAAWEEDYALLAHTRPTASNLFWA